MSFVIEFVCVWYWALFTVQILKRFIHSFHCLTIAEAVCMLVDADDNTLRQTKSIIEAAKNGNCQRLY